MSQPTDDERDQRLTAKHDQLWAYFEASQEQLVRIADHGPANADDLRMVKMGMNFLAAMICHRKAREALEATKPPPEEYRGGAAGDRHRRFVRVGEFRIPNGGEWYLSGAVPEAWLCHRTMSSPYQILREIE